MVPTIVDKLAFVDLIIMNGLKKIAKMWRNSPQVICNDLFISSSITPPSLPYHKDHQLWVVGE